MSKLIGISRSKYRVAISDILPYERPIFFTNRFFARFLKNYGVVCKEGRLIATKNQCDGLDDMLSILGGIENVRRPSFQYTIAKNCTDKGRKLTVIHPYHQVEMIEFYDRYKMVITDFCQRSNYSIRFPHKVAVVQKKPKGFPKYLSDMTQENHPEESIKHFFAYKYYHNINDFYDDYRFLRAEKNYAFMEKTDLEHCFDNIKPELLSQAMFGCTMDKATGTMPSVFYKLNESYENKPVDGNPGDGIVIGPEFSRIYAEIILQRVDVECENILQQMGVVLNRDYVFYRYVDDGFLFYNNEKVKNHFDVIYESCLLKYGLKRGEEKTIPFNAKPFSENISAGKIALVNLIDLKFENRLNTFKGFKKVQTGIYDTPTVLEYKSFIQSVRAIIQIYGLKYKDVMSFILGVMNKRISSLLSDFNELYKQYCQAEYDYEISEQALHVKQKYEHEFLLFINNLAEVIFYFFCCDPRMSTSIKSVSIINQLQLFVRGKFLFDNGEWSSKFDQPFIEEFDNKITDLTQNLFSTVTSESVCTIEVLNFLETQKCMSTSVRIHPRRLCSLYKTIGDNINFFSAFQFLHYIKNDVRYDTLKSDLIEWIANKTSCLWQDKQISDTEAVLTFFETLCCPWVEMSAKEKLIDHFDQFDARAKQAVLSFASGQKDMFVKWRDYSVLEEMQHINNTEVY